MRKVINKLFGWLKKKDSNHVFLSELLNNHTYWKQKAEKVRRIGGTGEKEEEYAQAYLLLLHQFTKVD